MVVIPDFYPVEALFYKLSYLKDRFGNMKKLAGFE